MAQDRKLFPQTRCSFILFALAEPFGPMKHILHQPGSADQDTQEQGHFSPIHLARCRRQTPE